MRLVLDTNVVVSGLICDGPPRQSPRLGREWRHRLRFSNTVLLEELAGALERRKFAAAFASRNLRATFLTQRYGAVTTLVFPGKSGSCGASRRGRRSPYSGRPARERQRRRDGRQTSTGAGSVPGNPDSPSCESTGNCCTLLSTSGLSGASAIALRAPPHASSLSPSALK